MMTYYCLGFLFDDTFDHVLLIHKRRSLYAGLWNGVGGVVGPDEAPDIAMTRECMEETGIWAPGWARLGWLADERQTWNVSLYAYNTNKLAEAVTKTDELVSIWNVRDVLDLNCAPHTKAIIMHARDRMLRPHLTTMIAITERPYFKE